HNSIYSENFPTVFELILAVLDTMTGFMESGTGASVANAADIGKAAAAEVQALASVGTPSPLPSFPYEAIPKMERVNACSLGKALKGVGSGNKYREHEGEPSKEGQREAPTQHPRLTSDIPILWAN